MQFTDIEPELDYATNLVLTTVEMCLGDDPRWPTILLHLKQILEDDGLAGRLRFLFAAEEFHTQFPNYLRNDATEGRNP